MLAWMRGCIELSHLGFAALTAFSAIVVARHTGYEADVNDRLRAARCTVLDYPLAVVLIASPWIFGFNDVGGAAVAIPIIIGALAFGQSLITDWDLSVARIVPLPIHLVLDAFAGIVLAISPFVFGFSDGAPMHGCRWLSSASECSVPAS